MRILQCKDSVFFYNTCNKTKKKIKQIQKSTSGTITGPGHLHHDFQFLQLTVLQFWKGKMGFGSLMWWEVRCRVAGLDGIGRESERVELKGVMSQGRVIDIMTFNSYSLQNYSFWKGTRIIGSSDCFR